LEENCEIDLQKENGLESMTELRHANEKPRN